jgi:hypothetical protein
MEEIATKQRVSIGLVSKVVCLHRLYGQVTDPFVHHAGCPSFLEHDDLEYLSAILDANPGLYLDEIQDKLATVGIYMSQLLPSLVPSKNLISPANQQRELLHREMRSFGHCGRLRWLSTLTLISLSFWTRVQLIQHSK